MSTILITIESQALVPILQVFKAYFDEKYPCTNEFNDGSQMSVNDEVKFATYEYLLDAYNKCQDVFEQSYKDAYNKLAKLKNEPTYD